MFEQFAFFFIVFALGWFGGWITTPITRKVSKTYTLEILNEEGAWYAFEPKTGTGAKAESREAVIEKMREALRRAK
jgi:hypothetical protein